MSAIKADGREDLCRMMSFMQLPKPRHFVHQKMVKKSKEIIKDETADGKEEDVKASIWNAQSFSCIEASQFRKQKACNMKTDIQKRDKKENLENTVDEIDFVVDAG